MLTESPIVPSLQINDTRSLADLLRDSAARHRQLCPRQVLGARMGLLGMAWLGLDRSSDDKRLLVIVETDGCFADGIVAASGCSIGARTLRVIDHGKVAAVFIDVETDQAVRITPHAQARQRAFEYMPGAPSKWHTQRDAYQIMPADELFTVRPVELVLSLAQLLSKPGCKATCEMCGEEIINEREVVQRGRILCRSCAGDRYWR